ncbi:MAG: tetratricopeptide repeat protein [Terriglobia bacterium]
MFLALLAALGCPGGIVADSISAANVVPESPSAKQFQQAATLLRQGKYAEAEVGFENALKTDPKFAPAYLGLAEIRVGKGDVAGAGAYLQKAVALDPRSQAVQTDWGHYLFFERRYGEAKQAFTKAIALDPKVSRPHYELGDLYLLGLHQPAEAAAEYREALAIDPANSRVHYTLANALVEEGRLDDAQSQLEGAVRLDPKKPALLKALGDFYLRRGKPDQAQQAYDRALVVDPKYVPAQIGKGDALVAKGDLNGAIADYTAVLQVAPRATDALVKIAILRDRQGQWEEAERFYRRALDASPKLGPASNNLAWLLLQHHQNPAEAVKLASQTVKLYPASANFQDTLAWALRANKDSAGALIAVKKAAALGPKNPQILYHLGVLYQEAGKPALAVRSYAQALAISRAFDGAEDAESRLAALKKHN